MAHLYNIAINVLMFFNKYHCIALSKFLNITLSFLSSACFTASLSLDPSIFIVPLTRIYASL